MTVLTSTWSARRALLRHLPLLALALAAIAVMLLALGPIGWRVGWWHFRFGLQTLMPWAAYVGIATLIVSAFALLLGRSRREWRGIAIAVLAFAVGALVAYVPWHYNQIRQLVPPIHDITTDPADPPAFAEVMALRTGEGVNPSAYEGDKIAEQQRRAYPDIVPLTVGIAPGNAFHRALDTAQRMGWTIVTVDEAAGRIEASDRSRWYGFTDDVAIRVTAAGSGSRIDVRSSSRLGRSDFGVNAARIRAYVSKYIVGLSSS